MSRHEVATRRVLYEIPGMQSVPVRETTFTGADGQPVPMRVYGEGAATVVLLAGFPDAGFEQHVGCRFMEMEWTISMAQLLAASGMRAITHSNRDALADGRALLSQLDGRAGIWSTSGNGPVALEAASLAACTVLINPMTKDACPETPLFVVRAGQDENPGLNDALDGFIARAIANNRPLTVVNCPDARHSFELYLDRPETRRVLQQGIDFLRAHLASNAQSMNRSS